MGHKPKVTPKKAAAYRAAAAPASPPASDGEMSEIAANEEARRRWGESGVAWHPAYTKRGEYRFCAVCGAVGEMRDEWQVFGRGATFEDAFREAEARGH